MQCDKTSLEHYTSANYIYIFTNYSLTLRYNSTRTITLIVRQI